nr:MAG TPA: hypothetical protein [Caudoviricetes sp.]
MKLRKVHKESRPFNGAAFLLGECFIEFLMFF